MSTRIRFIAIILDPGRIWSDYGVVDTDKFIQVCKCSQQGDAETIAACLNLQHREKDMKLLEQSSHA